MRVFPLLCGPSCLFHVHVHVDQSATPMPIRRDSCENEAMAVISRTHIKMVLNCVTLSTLLKHSDEEPP